MKLEICVDSMESVRACVEGGADRIELCAGLLEGGTTPSAGMMIQARRVFEGEVVVMIRPRGGDFIYDPDEVAVMAADIELAKDLGADAAIFGALTPAGDLDLPVLETLREACGGMPAVFHRAVDVSRDPEANLEMLVDLGFTRVLTSGGRPSVMESLPTLASWAAQWHGRLEILPGGGVRPELVNEVLSEVGVDAVHLSARRLRESAMEFRRPEIPMGATTVPGEYERRIADAAVMREIRERWQALERRAEEG